MAAAETIATGLSKVLSGTAAEYLDAFGACHSKTSRPNVHRLRIATRKLRVAVSLCEGADNDRIAQRIRKALRRPFKDAGRVRDLQVAATLLKRRSVSEPEIKPLRGSLKKRARRKRLVFQRSLQGKRSARIQRLTSALANSLQEAANKPLYHRRVAVLLDRQLRTVSGKFLAMPPPGLRAAELHKTRIALKRFRYAVDLVTPLVGGGADSLAAELRYLQHELGQLMDLNFLLGELTKYAHKHRKRRAALATLRAELRRARDARARIVTAELRRIRTQRTHAWDTKIGDTG